MKRMMMIMAVGLSLTAFSAHAEPSAKQVELVRRYLEATQLVQTLQSTMQGMRATMLGPLTAQLKPDQKKAVDEAYDATLGKFYADYFARVEPIFAEVFSEEELVQLVAFYESPVGRSMIAKTPQLQAKLLPLVSEMMPQVQQDLLTNICARVDCGPETQRPKTPVRRAS